VSFQYTLLLCVSRALTQNFLETVLSWSAGQQFDHLT
jgi:hypothetical protein